MQVFFVLIKSELVETSDKALETLKLAWRHGLVGKAPV